VFNIQYYTKYWGILYVEHRGNIYLHKILRNTVCWTLWEDLFTENTEEYCTVFNVQYSSVFCVNKSSQSVQHTVYFSVFCVNKYTKYWGILYIEHCGKIYLHKILRNTWCWALREDLFTQNNEEYCMLNTVGRFIYTSSVFCVNKSSHSVQYKVFLSIFCK
jgi:hypothetical protein